MKKYILGSILMLMLALSACDTTDDPPPNPFDPFKNDTTTTTVPVDVDPNSIVGLQYNIFTPTCANSGCHDGTFEPDFRSIESSYNTLVNHPIIKNNPDGDFSLRVKPGDAAKSVLWERLNTDIDGQSGIMPLVVDPDSDWDDKKDEYLENIKKWINDGAKDMFGNAPLNGNLQPAMRGVVAYANGNLLSRKSGDGYVNVPAGAQEIEIWIALYDDSTDPDKLQHNKAKFSTSLLDFSNALEKDLSIEPPITEDGYFGEPVSYYHKVTLDVSAYQADERVFMRVYVKDPSLTEITEIPGSGSQNYIKEYFSFQIN